MNANTDTQKGDIPNQGPLYFTSLWGVASVPPELEQESFSSVERND